VGCDGKFERFRVHRQSVITNRAAILRLRLCCLFNEVPFATQQLMKRFYVFSLVLVLFLAFGGCQKSLRPSGLPPLHPCTITVAQKGTPLADASVQLIAKEASIWPVTGMTDAVGKAVMVTYGQFKGAPLGEYTVVISKKETVDEGRGDDHQSGVTSVFSLVAVEHTKPETSTLRITVQKGKNAETFDVGEPVRILVDTVRPGT